MTALTAPNPRQSQLRIDFHYNNVIDARFLERVMDDPLQFVRGDDWLAEADGSCVTGKVVARADYHRAGRTEVLVELEGAIAHVILIDLALHIRVAASSQEAIDAVLDELREAMPVDDGAEESVPVRLWWWEGNSPQEMGRRRPGLSAREIELNYSARTWQQLAPRLSWSDGPAPGGRLLLWHGKPGTGKTTAVRTLARAWRDWADFQFIADPELFLDISAYMLSNVGGNARHPAEADDPRRWRVLVLEDSGEFLAPDAKTLAGQSVSRLLNVCDGALGHATRSLVLITTNEHLKTLHPAIARPGRCLAAVEFHDLDSFEVDGWCRSRGASNPTRAARRSPTSMPMPRRGCPNDAAPISASPRQRVDGGRPSQRRTRTLR